MDITCYVTPIVFIEKMETGRAVNTPTNSPIMLLLIKINPEFNKHSFEYIEHIII